jgi:peptide/nickel transport system permease protein
MQFGVTRRILHSFPATVELVISGMIVGVFFGVLAGVVSALKRNTWIDHIVRLFTTSGYALPLIWTGLLLQQIVGLYWGLLPISGRVTTITLEPARITGLFVLDSILTGNIPSLLTSLEHLILPSIAMGFYTIAVISRITRGETLNALSQDYILTARAKGLKERAVVLKHAFKNALLPVITISGMQFAAMLSGVVITETIFNFNGIGLLFILSLERRDYPTIQGIMVLAALVTSIASLIIDLIYYKIDPRVKL